MTAISSTNDRAATIYGRAEMAVEQMIEIRAPFGRVESFIDGFPGLTDDERAALWMLAWARGNGWRERQRILAEAGGSIGR